MTKFVIITICVTGYLGGVILVGLGMIIAMRRGWMADIFPFTSPGRASAESRGARIMFTSLTWPAFGTLNVIFGALAKTRDALNDVSERLPPPKIKLPTLDECDGNVNYWMRMVREVIIRNGLDPD
jgi:hypothetical protein